ncbi:Sperm-associated antigen 17 [Dinochytrium kinnereticum]|nr:Sperm-associated antigen 17 [Dinochytrium kinnereticum]
MSKGSKNAPVQPVIVPIPNPEGELNDDDWTAFIFTMVPDCKLHDSNINVPTIQQLSDHISSGIRQKFAVIQRSELLNWATETSKVYEVCKDVKSQMDSSQSEADFPDNLMARLVKLRLLVLKHDGIEQRNALKLSKEASDPAIVQSDLDPQKAGKAGKKDEKGKDRDKDKEKEKEKDKEKEKEKEKDRGKLMSPKKPSKDSKGAGTKAVTEAISRPTSGQDKRKSKFKERGGKGDSKPMAIDDEPEDGPDAYYFLRDFNLPGLLNALMEDCNVQVHTVITVECCGGEITTPNPLCDGQDGERIQKLVKPKFPPNQPYRTSTSRLISTLREWMLSCDDESMWRNVTWGDIRRYNFTDARDLFDLSAFHIYDVLKEKREFEAFYKNSQIISIPNGTLDVVDSNMDWRYYNSIIDKSPSLCSEILLEVLLELSSDNHHSSKDYQTMNPTLADIIHTNLSVNRHIGGRFNVAGNLQFSLEKNKNSLMSAGHQAYKYMGTKSDGLLERMRFLYPMRKYQTLAGHRSEKGHSTETPTESVLNSEEKMRKHKVFLGELRRLSKISERYRRSLELQLEFEDMLGISSTLDNAGTDSPFVSLDSWCWSEVLDASTLTQVLQEAKIYLPAATTRRSEKDGRQLLAMHGLGKVAVEGVSFTEELKVKTKVHFGLFHDLFPSNRDALDPFKSKNSILEEPLKETLITEKECAEEAQPKEPENKSPIPAHQSGGFSQIDMSSYLDSSESSLLAEEDLNDPEVEPIESTEKNLKTCASEPTLDIVADVVVKTDDHDPDIVYDMGGRIIHECSNVAVLYTSFGSQIKITQEIMSGVALYNQHYGGIYGSNDDLFNF